MLLWARVLTAEKVQRIGWVDAAATGIVARLPFSANSIDLFQVRPGELSASEKNLRSP